MPYLHWTHFSTLYLHGQRYEMKDLLYRPLYQIHEVILYFFDIINIMIMIFSKIFREFRMTLAVRNVACDISYNSATPPSGLHHLNIRYYVHYYCDHMLMCDLKLKCSNSSSSSLLTYHKWCRALADELWDEWPRNINLTVIRMQCLANIAPVMVISTYSFICSFNAFPFQLYSNCH